MHFVLCAGATHRDQALVVQGRQLLLLPPPGQASGQAEKRPAPADVEGRARGGLQRAVMLHTESEAARSKVQEQRRRRRGAAGAV